MNFASGSRPPAGPSTGSPPAGPVTTPPPPPPTKLLALLREAFCWLVVFGNTWWLVALGLAVFQPQGTTAVVIAGSWIFAFAVAMLARELWRARRRSITARKAR